MRRIGTAAVAVAAIVACAGTAAAASPARTTSSARSAGHAITSGTTRLTVDIATYDAYRKAGFSLSTAGRAKQTFSGVEYPIVGGHVNARVTSGRVVSSGGITISKGGTTIELSHSVAHLAARTVTAHETGAGTITELTLIGGSVQRRKHGSTFGGYDVRFAGATRRYLDRVFKTRVFARHPALGSGSTTLHYAAR